MHKSGVFRSLCFIYILEEGIMKGLKIDDGCKEYMINDDPDRVIKINPSDFDILYRMNSATKTINEAMEKYKNLSIKADGSADYEADNTAQAVREIGQLIRQQIDYIFNASVSDAVFGNQSPISLIKGQPYFVRFLDAILPEVEKEIKAEQKASEARINKYTKVYTK